MATETGMRRVALIGNPNTGKTSLFNALTGMKQRVGNYSGVTVEKKTGEWPLSEDSIVQLIDLPGTYSLSAKSLDERIAVDLFTGRLADQSQPDLVIVVVDVENLKRNLFLASQIADLHVPMVIALNCWDVVERKGLQIDCRLLENRLGVPVVPTIANRKRGREELATAVSQALESKPLMIRPTWPESVIESIDFLHEQLVTKRGEKLEHAELQRLIFDPKSAVQERLKTPETTSTEIIRSAREQLRKQDSHPDAAESLMRFKFKPSLTTSLIAKPRFINGARQKIDAILLHKFWGLVVFVGMMYIIFQSVYSWAGPFMSLIEGLTSGVQEIAASSLASTPMLQSLVVDGIIGGVGIPSFPTPSSDSIHVHRAARGVWIHGEPHSSWINFSSGVD